MRLRDRTAALTSLAGYGVHDPLMVGVQRDGTPPVFLTSGRTAAGEPLTADTIGAGVIQALARLDHLVSTPGTEHRYCNAGYICLAAIIERAASRPLPDFAREHVFTPLGMTSSQYWSGPAPHPPGAVPLDFALPGTAVDRRRRGLVHSPGPHPLEPGP